MSAFKRSAVSLGTPDMSPPDVGSSIGPISLHNAISTRVNRFLVERAPGSACSRTSAILAHVCPRREKRGRPLNGLPRFEMDLWGLLLWEDVADLDETVDGAVPPERDDAQIGLCEGWPNSHHHHH